MRRPTALDAKVQQGDAGSLRCGTLNCRSLAGDKIDDVCGYIATRKLDVLALQECSLGKDQRQSFRKKLKAVGHEPFFGSVQVNKANAVKGCLITTAKIDLAKPVKHKDFRRHRALVIKLIREKVVHVNVHLQSSQSTAAKMASIKSEWDHIADNNALAVWMGDFNLEPTELPLLEDGSCCSMDTAKQMMEPTRLGGERHIDYGIVQNGLDLRVTYRRMESVSGADAKSISDHYAVFYDIGMNVPSKVRTIQQREELDEVEVTQGEFLEMWKAFEVGYRQAKEQEDEQGCWAKVSRCAELLLAKGGWQERKEHEAIGGRKQPRHEKPEVKEKDIMQTSGIGRMPTAARKLANAIAARVQLDKQPHRADCYIKLAKRLKHLDQKYGDIGGITNDAAEDIKRLEAHLEPMRAHGRMDGISTWRENMCRDEAVSRWIVEDEPVETTVSSVAVEAHPQRLMEETVKVVRERWQQPGLPKEKTRKLLAKIQELVDPEKIERWRRYKVTISGEDLHRLIKKANRSAGPDAWSAKLLKKLPIGWWDKVAEVVELAAFVGRLPTMWNKAWVVLIDGTRPISIASQLWRTVGAAVLAAVAGWMADLLTPAIQGGIAGGDMETLAHAVASMLDRMTDPEFASEDLSKCFDRVDTEQACQILEACGAPALLTKLIAAFYHPRCTEGTDARPQVCFKTRNAVGYGDEVWCDRLLGLLQGCGLSCAILAVIMTIWSMWVVDDTKAVPSCFVDDRLLVAGDRAELEKALEITKQFDDLIGAVQNTNKGRCSDQVLADKYQLGQATDDFTYVGIEHSRAGLKVAKVRGREKVQHILSRIAKACRSRAQRIRLVKKHVTPRLRFAAAINGFDDKQAKEIALKVEKCVMRGKVWSGRSLAAHWKLVIGQENHPEFIRDSEVFMFRMRRLRKVRAKPFNTMMGVIARRQRPVVAPGGQKARATKAKWKEIHERREGCFEDIHYGVAEGRLDQVLTQWRWTKVDEGKFRLPGGDILDLEREDKRAIMEAAKEGFEIKMMESEKRGAITKLDGTPTAFNWDTHKCCWRAHMEFAASEVAMERMIASGSGVEVRSLGVPKPVKDDLRCACGAAWATRRHWMKDCTSPVVRSKALGPARCDAEAGLGVKVIPRVRKAIGKRIDVVQDAQALTMAAGEIFAGTDGSKKNDTCGASVVVKAKDGEVLWQCGFGVPGRSVSSYYAELEALHALLEVTKHYELEAKVYTDNLAVVQLMAKIMRGEAVLPRTCFAQWDEIAECFLDLRAFAIQWIPSHNKKAEWRCRWGCTDLGRGLNKDADALADKGRERGETLRRNRAAGGAEEAGSIWSREMLLRQRKGTQALLQSDDRVGNLLSAWF